MKELLNTGVSLPLVYDEENDALIGQVKGYSAAVKENLETGSYGCLFWVKEGDFTAITTAEEFLTDHQKSDLTYIKKFHVTEQGAAIALNRTDDEFTNVNNLKRFIFDFATNLSLNFYKNCCCECGRTDDLAIYSADGVIAQACSECGAKYRLIMKYGSENTLSSAERLPVKETAFAKAAEAAVIPEAVSELVLDEKSNETVTEEASPKPAEIKDSTEDISEFMLTEADIEAVKEEAAPKPAEIKDSTEDISEFMLTEADIEAPEEEKPAAVVQDDAENFDALLYDKEELKEPERPRSKLFEEAEREFAEEKARLAAEEAENPSENVLNELLINESGEIAIKEIEPETDDGRSDVTEIHDDSNDCENIEIEEIESTVTRPTITTGHPQLTAEETPLEQDGSVPLINPNSHREERHVSPVDGPDAVQPLELAQSITNEMVNRDETEKKPQNSYLYGTSAERSDVSSQMPPSYNTYAAGYSSYPAANFTDRSNAFIGILGALVIGLAGVAIWVLIADKLDTISYWGSLAIVFSVFGGYRLAGGAMDKKGIVISFIIALLMSAGAVAAMSVIDVMHSLEEVLCIDVSFFESMKWFIQTVANGENSSAFGMNMGITLIITLIASFVFSARLWKNA